MSASQQNALQQSKILEILNEKLPLELCSIIFKMSDYNNSMLRREIKYIIFEIKEYSLLASKKKYSKKLLCDLLNEIKMRDSSFKYCTYWNKTKLIKTLKKNHLKHFSKDTIKQTPSTDEFFKEYYNILKEISLMLRIMLRIS